MIISHRYKFIFIKTMKTAGTSIEVFLSHRCGEDDIVTEIAPHVPPHRARNCRPFYNHMPAVRIRELIGENVWSEYFKFCVERNPWDKAISFYYMLRNSWSHGAEKELSFDDYLARGPVCANYPLYTCARHEDIILDEVLRFENLPDDIGRVFTYLGIPFSGDLGVKAKSDWRTDRRHYREYLTAKQALRIAELYTKEIELHGYSF